MAAKFTKGMSRETTINSTQKGQVREAGSPNDAGLSRRNTMTGQPGHPKTGQSAARGGAEGGKSINPKTKPRDITTGRGADNAKRVSGPHTARGTMGKMEHLKGRAKTSMERPGRKGSVMYSLALLALPAILFGLFALTVPGHAHAAAIGAGVVTIAALAKTPLLAMTIQAWLPGEPAQQKAAQQGFFLKQAVSTTVSLAGATLLPSDLLLVTTMGAAGAVKMLGGQDTGNGPCIVGDTVTIMNHSGQNVSVYPNNAAGTVKNGAAGAATVLSNSQTAYAVYIGSDNWAMQAS